MNFQAKSSPMSAAAVMMGWMMLTAPMVASAQRISFDMVTSAVAANAGCLLAAEAEVTVHSLGPVERMDVRVKGLPSNTNFDFFVIQVPNTPFGLSWYQGDIQTNDNGRGHGVFIGSAAPTHSLIW